MSELKKYKHPEVFRLESGESIRDLTIAFHTFGILNKTQDNVVWVFHALSANSNVLDWWSGLFGEGCLYDPKKYFIVCVNTIGSPYGSTRPDNLSFPHFTLRDVVAAHLLLAKSFAIKKIHTLIGGSFGGNQAIEFAYSYQGKIDHMVLIASCAKESAWAIASHESQRLALKADPTFGSADGGNAGMKAARAMALLTYRTVHSFVDKQTDEEKTDGFKASSYIQYQGDKFVKRFSALCYYYLIKCLDTHDIGRGRGGQESALAHISVPTLVLGIDSDMLIPTSLQRFMQTHLPHAYYEEIHSVFGHDGFLIETEKISKKIEAFYLTLSSQLTKHVFSTDVT